MIHGLTPSLKEMTPLFSRCVDPLRECPLKPLHACHKIGLWRLKQEVIVIAHEKVGVNPPPRLFDGLLQRFEPYPTFPILPEDHLSPIPAAHDVVDRTPELHSWLPCHETILYLQNGNVNSLFHGLTPSHRCQLLTQLYEASKVTDNDTGCRLHGPCCEYIRHDRRGGEG